MRTNRSGEGQHRKTNRKSRKRAIELQHRIHNREQRDGGRFGDLARHTRRASAPDAGGNRSRQHRVSGFLYALFSFACQTTVVESIRAIVKFRFNLKRNKTSGTDEICYAQRRTRERVRPPIDLLSRRTLYYPQPHATPRKNRLPAIWGHNNPIWLITVWCISLHNQFSRVSDITVLCVTISHVWRARRLL